MTRTANGTIQLQLIGNVVNQVNGQTGDPTASWGQALDTIKFLTGVEDGQINRAIYKKDITIASAGTLTVDLFDFVGFDCGGGDGKDQLGQSMALEEVVILGVILKAGSAGQLQVGAEGSGAAWNSLFNGRDDAAIPIRSTATMPGLLLVVVPSSTGLEVTDVTSHLLKFAAVGGSVTFDLIIGGRDNP